MARPDTDLLIEQAVSAWRPAGPSSEILPHPAWCDLPPASRAAVFDSSLRSRNVEKLLDPEELSGTVKSVLRRMVA
jgi:hypothetical protein